jgi:MacB-like periplasmic core domain
LGNETLILETTRDQWGLRWLKTLLQDLRYGVRILRKSPFTTVAVLTLALGIGANTAIFSVVDGVVLRPLPYPDSNRIVYFGWFDKSFNPDLSVPQLKFLRDHATNFAAIAGYQGAADKELSPGATKRWVTAAFVTDGFFEALGVSPEIGRPFGREFTVPGGANAAILTDSLWRSTFGSDPNIVGRQIILDTQSYTVTGILPAGFKYTQPADLFDSAHLGHSIGGFKFPQQENAKRRDRELWKAEPTMPTKPLSPMTFV